MPILKHDAPELSQVCEAVKLGESEGDDWTRTDHVSARATAREIAADLIATIERTSNALGLAAPQLGYLKRIIAIRPLFGTPIVVMLNPHWVDCGNGMQVTEPESCLSYPRTVADVARFMFIDCEWTDLQGERQAAKFSGIAARVIQHECDHLQGVCLVGDAWRAEQEAKA